MLVEYSVDDVRSSLLVAVDLVTIDVIGGHRVAVSYDHFQHSFGKVFIRHTNEGVPQFMDG